MPPQSTTTTRPRSRPEGWRVKVCNILRELGSPTSPLAIWRVRSRAMASSAAAGASNRATDRASGVSWEAAMAVIILWGVAVL